MKTFLFLLILTQLAAGQNINKISFDRFSHYNPDDWITYAYSNHITSIDIGNYHIFFGTSNGGILRYNFFDEEWYYPLTSSTGLSSNSIESLYFDRNLNELIAYTETGTDIYNDSFGFWRPYSGLIANKNNTGSAKIINSFEPFSRPPIKDWPVFFPEENYNILTDGTFYNPENEEFKILDRLVDEWKRLWFATNGSGIGIVNLNSYTIEFKKQSISAIFPRDIYVDNDNIWIAGYPFDFKNRGITYWDYSLDQWQYFKSGSEYEIFSDNISVIEGLGSFVFFGSDQGLIMYNAETKKWNSLRNLSFIKGDEIIDLYTLSNQLYIATINGAFRYNPFEKTIEKIATSYIDQTRVNCLSASDSLLFIGTNYGIFSYQPEMDKSMLLKSTAAIADNFIDALEYGENKLWFAGRNGIGYHDFTDGSWKSFPGLNYSLRTKFNDIVISKNLVWFATEDGLLKYNTDMDNWYLYTIKDGLAHNSVNRIELDGAYMWLATKKGITLFRWNSKNRIE